MPEEETILKQSFVTKQKRKRKFQEYDGRLVTPELMDKLSGTATTYAINRAEISWKARLEKRDESQAQNMTWQDVSISSIQLCATI